MSQTESHAGLATRRALDVRATPRRLRSSIKRPLVPDGPDGIEELQAQLAELQQQYSDLHHELFEATQVHRRLCAPRLIRYGDFEIASEIFAVRHLPGDFFTVKETNAGVILALGDICGKGLAAGMWTTHLVGLVGARAIVTSDPESIVAGVNRDICLMSSVVPLATLLVARLDPVSGSLEYCSAGHPPALLLRANGKVEPLSEGGLMLGVVPGAPYVRGCVKLMPGDVVLAFTDGVTESVNHAQEEFGMERLEANLRGAREGSADSLLYSLLGMVQDFAATRPLVDDLSLVVISRRAGA